MAMDRTLYSIGDRAKINETGETVTILDRRPVGLSIFYEVETENGDSKTVSEKSLRPSGE